MKEVLENFLYMFDREANIYTITIVVCSSILIVWLTVFLLVFQPYVFLAIVAVGFGYCLYVVGSGKDR